MENSYRQDLFGYYVNNVLERKDSDHEDQDMFLVGTENEKVGSIHPQKNLLHTKDQAINDTIIRGDTPKLTHFVPPT